MKKLTRVLVGALCMALTMGGVANATGQVNSDWNQVLNQTMQTIDQLTATPGELTVHGTAALAIAPDKATLSVGAMFEDASVSVAQTKVNETIAAIVTAMKELGIPEEKMATNSYNVYPTFDYNTNTPTLRGYQVTNMLTIEVENFELISQAIDKAVTAGANQINGINFDTVKRPEIYRQALATAVDAAREKAEILAAAAGKELGELRSLVESEQGDAVFLNAYDSVMMKGAGAGAQILGGEINVNAKVTLVFELK